MKETMDYPFFAIHEESNLGCGRSRSKVFEAAHGRYVYFLDDDAYIPEDQKDFFTKAIAFLEAHNEVATLTTAIYDTAWKKERIPRTNNKNGVKQIYMFMFGSVFLRRAIFQNMTLCFLLDYGYEELKPSLMSVRQGCVNAFYGDVKAIHDPEVNKWNKPSSDNKFVLIRECAAPCATHFLMYPIIYHPLIKLAFYMRSWKHLRQYGGSINEARQLVRKIVNENKAQAEKLSVENVYILYKKYGLSIF
jgi:glycosyltransferase involved in cell wall biosynthesis